jgi:hypothetical protein
MSLSFSDLETLSNVAMKVDANPVVLVGRFLGLSAEEQAVGVPKWGWIALAAGAAVAGGLLLQKKFSKNYDSESAHRKKKRSSKSVKRSKMFKVVGKKVSRSIDDEDDDE